MNMNWTKPLNIVLVNPEIPQNTGNIGRLCVCTNSKLHLIRPLGFSLDKKDIKRAGLDYWPHLNIAVHQSWEDFISKEKPTSLFFATTKSNKSYFNYHFTFETYLIFGNETRGLPSNFYQVYQNQCYTIPMLGEHSRSLNLANAVSVVLFEAVRQLHPTLSKVAPMLSGNLSV